MPSLEQNRGLARGAYEGALGNGAAWQAYVAQHGMEEARIAVGIIAGALYLCDGNHAGTLVDSDRPGA
jgi:hypothetical protein